MTKSFKPYFVDDAGAAITTATAQAVRAGTATPEGAAAGVNASGYAELTGLSDAYNYDLYITNGATVRKIFWDTQIPVLLGPQPAAIFTRTSSQTGVASGGSGTAVIWTDSEVDTDTMWTPAAANRMTFQTDGLFAIDGALTWNADGTGTYRAARLVIQGTAIAEVRQPPIASGSGLAQQVQALRRVTVGQWVELVAEHNGSGPLSLVPGSALGLRLSAHRVGQ